MSDGSLPFKRNTKIAARIARVRGADLRTRFFEYAIPSTDPNACWGWSGEKQKAGYALLNAGKGQRRRAPASRISWSLHHGKQWPEGMIACHRCDNPECVNPLHIWPGTDADNTHDAITKGRFRTRSVVAVACKRGHDYTPENTHTRIKPNGRVLRICRACNRERANRPESRAKANIARQKRRMAARER